MSYYNHETHNVENEPVTRVVFRKWRKKYGSGVIAIFPDEKDVTRGTVQMYEHVGQHGHGSYSDVISRSTLATPEEYAGFKRELESSPYNYNLKVVKRA